MCENRTTMSDSTATRASSRPPQAGHGLARASCWRCCSSAPSSPCCIWTGWARKARCAAQLARNASQINAALLRNNLDKFRALPFVLTRDVDLRAALLDPVPAQIGPLDEKLEALSRGVGAAAIYVLDRTGYAIAASNWREPASLRAWTTSSGFPWRGRAWLPSTSRSAPSATKPACTCPPRRRARWRHARRGGAEGGFPRAGGRLAPVQRADLRHRRTRRGPAGQPASMALRRAGAAIRRAGAAAAHQPASATPASSPCRSARRCRPAARERWCAGRGAAADSGRLAAAAPRCPSPNRRDGRCTCCRRCSPR